jgi:NAD(P)H dehydrogenase (quinone)
MNVLVVYTHPYNKSFNHALKDATVSELESAGHTVRVLDLYESGFNPVLSGADLQSFRTGEYPADIAEAQDHLKWADHWVFIYPIWWTGMPALLKGWVDRTFAYGFAYAYGDSGIVKKLEDKKVLLVNTAGTPDAYYQHMIPALALTSATGLFEFCGVTVSDQLHFGAPALATPEQREEMIAQTRAAALKLVS